MDDNDHSDFSRTISPDSKRVLCLTVFWIILTVFIIMAGVTLILVALGMLGMTGLTITGVDGVCEKFLILKNQKLDQKILKLNFLFLIWKTQ